MNKTIDLRETVILVDFQDQEIGTLGKIDAHSGTGTLHRAISVFLIDGKCRILMQKRHPQKLVWGGFWSNSCCTHPFVGETTIDSATRRIQEELGLKAQLRFHFKLKYQASFSDEHAEHELVSVYTGKVVNEPVIDPQEIEELNWVTPKELDRDLVGARNLYTPWCIFEWRELRARNIL